MFIRNRWYAVTEKVQKCYAESKRLGTPALAHASRRNKGPCHKRKGFTRLRKIFFIVKNCHEDLYLCRGGHDHINHLRQTWNQIELGKGGQLFHTKSRFWNNFEAKGRTSADVQFSTQIQVKSKKRSSLAYVLFFTDIQRGAVEKKSSSAWFTLVVYISVSAREPHTVKWSRGPFFAHPRLRASRCLYSAVSLYTFIADKMVLVN